jgi:hypothetical protein
VLKATIDALQRIKRLGFARRGGGGDSNLVEEPRCQARSLRLH